MSEGIPDLTLLVPCFNEAPRLDALLRALRAFVDGHAELCLEVLFVDDGSRDETPSLLAGASFEGASVHVVALTENAGKGAALRAGMESSTGRNVLFFDADLAVDLSHVMPALELLAQGADVVVGCRNVAGAEVRRPQGLVRRLLGRGYRRASSWWLGLRVSDVTCGFKAFRGELGRRVFAASRSTRWGFDAEVLFLAQRAGAVMVELPVQWAHGDGSAVRLGRDVLGAGLELFSVRFRAHTSLDPETAEPAPAEANAKP